MRTTRSTNGAALAADEPSGRGSFCIVRADLTLRRALSYVGAQAGWTERLNPCDDTVVVSDAVEPLPPGDLIGRRRILVIAPTPLAARGAVSALAGGVVLAVFSSDAPDDLRVALESIDAGRAMIPARVIEMATSMPDLTGRQIAIIAGVMAAQSNREIARRLRTSDTTVKRELGEIFRLCGVANRQELAHCGALIGIDPSTA